MFKVGQKVIRLEEYRTSGGWMYGAEVGIIINVPNEEEIVIDIRGSQKTWESRKFRSAEDDGSDQLRMVLGYIKSFSFDELMQVEIAIEEAYDKKNRK